MTFRQRCTSRATCQSCFKSNLLGQTVQRSSTIPLWDESGCSTMIQPLPEVMMRGKKWGILRRRWTCRSPIWRGHALRRDQSKPWVNPWQHTGTPKDLEYIWIFSIQLMPTSIVNTRAVSVCISCVQVACHYARTWLIVDVVTAIPFEYVLGLMVWVGRESPQLAVRMGWYCLFMLISIYHHEYK